MKESFEIISVSPSNLVKLNTINDIVIEYQDLGYKLTLRQLYYQLVSRDIIPNKQEEYKKIGTLLTKGRMAGIVDWDAIEDRLRVVDKPYFEYGISEALQRTAKYYKLDRQEGQEKHIEVWVEKDAISNIVKRTLNRYGIPLMVNRGYSSTTAIHDAYERFSGEIYNGREVLVLYLGDHDPSGLDMIRDIETRVSNMLDSSNADYVDSGMFSVKPIALTMDQIRMYSPPPNPAKITDTRSVSYISEYGRVSWEVDALSPDVLDKLLVKEVEAVMDMDVYEEVVNREKKERRAIYDFAERVGDEE